MKRVSPGKLFGLACIVSLLVVVAAAFLVLRQNEGELSSALAQDVGAGGDGADSSSVLMDLLREASAIEERERREGRFYTNANLAMLKLKIEKMGILAKAYSRTRGVATVAEQELRDARFYLSLLREGKDKPPSRTGMFEMAYISKIDDSPQPYVVAVPTSYDPEKSFPLIVYLHGYSPDLNKINWWMSGMMRNEQLVNRAEANGYLLACCFGRGNTDFQSIGEVDVLDVIDEMKRRYNVDEDRVYLSGLSMGGLGAWTIGAHYPDLFAAIAPVSGRADFYLWQYMSMKHAYTPATQAPPDSELAAYKSKVAPFQRWLLDGDFGKPLRRNFMNLPVFMLHGEDDHLDKCAQSRQMVSLLKEMGYTVKYHEFEGGDHWIGYEKAFKDDRVFDWLNNQKRNVHPKRVSFKTYTTRYNKAYWVILDELNEWGKPANVNAEIVGKNSIRVRTANVAELTLALSDEIVDCSKRLRLTLNGNQTRREIPKDGRIKIRVAEAGRRGGLHKRHGLTGPIRDAYLSRFIIVYGSIGDDAERARDKARAAKAASEWVEYAQGMPTVKSDKNVTEKDIEDANLILFGTAKSNSILKRIAGKIPVEIRDKEFSLLGKTFKGEDIGLVMIYPNPLNPKRYIVIYSGLSWGEGLPFNHKLDLLPDYIVFTAELDGDVFSSPYAGQGPNSFLCAGFFDTSWELSDKLVWYRNR